MGDKNKTLSKIVCQIEKLKKNFKNVSHTYVKIV